ncbi:MAG: ethanolamine utilization microcompartment protein EutL [Faecousia sp.]
MRPLIPVKILSVQYLPNADPALCRTLGVQGNWRCLGLLSTDSDDATYIALDQATKDSTVRVSYARSLYAGASNASTPLAGEIIGILAGPTPSEVRSGMESALSLLTSGTLGFRGTQARESLAYLAYTVSRTGSYLSAEAGIREGEPLAYLIAPPVEAVTALDAALKAADVRLVKFYGPPTETNFGGGLLTGTQAACNAACEAFSGVVEEIAANPVKEE